MKNALLCLSLSFLAAGCVDNRLQIHDVMGTCGTNYETTFHETLLLNPKTGKTWALRWDDQKYYWQSMAFTNAPETSK
jgi:hypothetical protein